MTDVVRAISFVAVFSSLVSCKEDKPKVQETFSAAGGDVAKVKAKGLVDQVVQWQMSNPSSQCPPSLEAVEADASARKDPWGSEFHLVCGDQAPAGVPGGVGVMSSGPDGKEGTADDVRSW